jgi:hypothetical protein
MITTDLAEARRAHAALREIFSRHVGDAADFRALRRVLTLCHGAAQTVDDAYCREKLRLVGEYGAELFSTSGHAKWGRDSASGAEFLRQQVLSALELFASRLYSIEALRRCGESDSDKNHGGVPWITRSGIAQT